MKKDKIRVGDIWFVRVEDTNELQKLQVINQYQKVVEVKPVVTSSFGGVVAQPSQFFCWADLSFIEKVGE